MQVNNVRLILVVLLLAGFPVMSWAQADDMQQNTSVNVEPSQDQGNAVVMQAFTSKEPVENKVVVIEDKTKRIVMFLMGVPLLLLLITTVILGIAMGVYGKRVFLAHMLCAGLSMTLALAHAVVGIVWFYPF